MLRFICALVAIAFLGYATTAEARLFGGRGGMNCSVARQVVDAGPPQAKAEDIAQLPSKNLAKPLEAKTVLTVLNAGPKTLSGVDLKGLAALNAAPAVNSSASMSNVASK